MSSAAVVAAVRDAWRAYQRACNGASALLSPLTHVYLRTREDARLERVRRGEYSVFFVGEYCLFMPARVDVGAVLPFRDLLRRFFYRAVLRPLGARLTASLSACLDAGESEWSEQRLCRLLAPAAGEGDAERGALDRVVRAYRERHRVAEIACALAPLGLPVLLLLRVHEWQCAADAGDCARRWRAAALVHRRLRMKKERGLRQRPVYALVSSAAATASASVAASGAPRAAALATASHASQPSASSLARLSAPQMS